MLTHFYQTCNKLGSIKSINSFRRISHRSHHCDINAQFFMSISTSKFILSYEHFSSSSWQRTKWWQHSDLSIKLFHIVPIWVSLTKLEFNIHRKSIHFTGKSIFYFPDLSSLCFWTVQRNLYKMLFCFFTLNFFSQSTSFFLGYVFIALYIRSIW